MRRRPVHTQAIPGGDEQRAGAQVTAVAEHQRHARERARQLLVLQHRLAVGRALGHALQAMCFRGGGRPIHCLCNCKPVRPMPKPSKDSSCDCMKRSSRRLSEMTEWKTSIVLLKEQNSLPFEVKGHGGMLIRCSP